MKTNIEFIDKPSREDQKIIFKIVYKDGLLHDIKAGYHDYSFFIKDKDDKIVGGIVCQHVEALSELCIQLLGVNPSIKGKGFGKELMKRTEKLAKELKCDFIVVATLEYQIRGFYEKCGFEVEFVRKNKNSKLNRYYLRKDL